MTSEIEQQMLLKEECKTLINGSNTWKRTLNGFEWGKGCVVLLFSG